MSDWYDVSGAPATSASLSSSAIRAEFSLIETAMAKLPSLSGNGNKLVKINSGATALEAASNVIISGTDNTNAMLRVTQLGTGNALLIEDSSNPDSTPFVVDASGRLAAGHTAALAVKAGGASSTPTSQVIGSSEGVFSVLTFSSTSNAGAGIGRSRSDSIGTHTALQSDDSVGGYAFFPSDGTDFLWAATVRAKVDGSVSTGIVPTRIELATMTAAGTVTEGYRLKSTQESWFQANNSTAAVTITQTGSGNALVVEDSSNPDSTPFVVDASGNVAIGHTAGAAYSISGTTAKHLLSSATTGAAGFASVLWANGAAGSAPAIQILKSRGASAGSYSIVSSGDTLGQIAFGGDDGAAFIVAATIVAASDGTPGTNDMPGRLVFSTTADGASSTTERLRIDNKGNVIVGTAQLSDAASDGFLYIPGTTSGAPSGTPTAYSGRHPIVYDDTNNRLYVWNGSAWKYAALT